MKKVIALALMGAFCFVAGCKEKGPMEQAGEKVDDAVKDVKKEMNK